MTEDDLVIIGLASAVVHLLEATRPSGSPLDYVAASVCLEEPRVARALRSIEPVLLPLPRDGADARFDFPEGSV